MASQLKPKFMQAAREEHFERNIWPLLPAAYNFARWMVQSHHDAEDIVQESFVKAFKFADTFRGTDPRSWLMAIVRNSALTFLQRNQQQRMRAIDDSPEPIDTSANPEVTVVRSQRAQTVRTAIARLPEEFREALLLREMEGMAYKEIAEVLKVPIGTVMSRLSRARTLLMEDLVEQKEVAK